MAISHTKLGHTDFGLNGAAALYMGGDRVWNSRHRKGLRLHDLCSGGDASDEDWGGRQQCLCGPRGYRIIARK